MTRDTYKAAKMAALNRHKEKAQRDMNTATTKRQLNNATRRYHQCKQAHDSTNFRWNPCGL